MPEPNCSVEDCEEPHDALGYCKAHYMRFCRYGDPLFAPSRGPGERSRRFWDAVRETGALELITPLDDLDDAAFGHWLAGFMDGEASFVINGGHRRGYYARMHLLLRADDVALLAGVHRRTGLGSLYYCANESRTSMGRPGVLWVVYSRSDCLGLVRLLDRYPLLSKKARDYAIWREAVTAMQTKLTGGRRQDWSDMATFKVRIQAVRTYVSPTGTLF
jgi:hypothetical protein